MRITHTQAEQAVAIIRDYLGAEATVCLFGSRVRDDWRPDSDYDILVIV